VWSGSWFVVWGLGRGGGGCASHILGAFLRAWGGTLVARFGWDDCEGWRMGRDVVDEYG
jgi:hypothetical protein